ENRRDSRRYWLGYGGRAVAGIAMLAFLVSLSVSPPTLPSFGWPSGGSGSRHPHRPVGFTASPRRYPTAYTAYPPPPHPHFPRTTDTPPKPNPMPNQFPELHNAMWPGLVGKGSPGAEPSIDLDTMLDMTAKAEVNGQRFDGVDIFLFDPHINIDISDDDLKKSADKIRAKNFVVG